MKARNYSHKREAILEKVCNTVCHPTADWVFQSLRDKYPDLSLGTVYRNLVLFKEEGSIVSLGTVDGKERFDGCTKPHEHFICTRCGDITDIDLQIKQNELEAHVQQIHNCKVDRVDCTVYGTCGTCLKGEA